MGSWQRSTPCGRMRSADTVARIGLVGCGTLGYPLAHYMARLGFDALCLHDLDERRCMDLKRAIEATGTPMTVEVGVARGGLDVILLSISGPATTAFVSDPSIHALFRGPPVFVSLGRPNYDNLAAQTDLGRDLAQRGVRLLFGLGLEPGLVEILMSALASVHANRVRRLDALCGGVPQQPIPPLNYDLLFGDRLPALNRRALIRSQGELSSCLRFDMKEQAFVDGVGMLDVYHDGLSPSLLDSPAIRDIPNVTQRTGRWPGFFNCMKVLLDLGLLDTERAIDGGPTVSDFTHRILRSNGRLEANRPDVTFVEIGARLVAGDRAVIRVIANYDPNTDLTGMAQLTSFVAVWAARREVDAVSPKPPGLFLAHEVVDPADTQAILSDLERHATCVITTTKGLRVPATAWAEPTAGTAHQFDPSNRIWTDR